VARSVGGSGAVKISAKGRYALASAIEIARQSGMSGENVSSASISKSLGISKVFLEQIMAGMKKAELVTSVKGAGGGYKFLRPIENITAWDILITAESALFEKTDSTVADNSPSIEAVLREQIFCKLDSVLKSTLKQITLRELLDASNYNNEEQAFMLNM